MPRESHAFDATPAYGFTRPNSYGDALWHGLFDTAQTQVGDYLVGGDGTWFIAAQQPILPTICVACDRIVSIRRPAAPGAVGALGYSATVPDDEAVLMQGWPAGMVMRGIAKHGEANLPGEGPLGTMLVYLPASRPRSRSSSRLPSRPRRRRRSKGWLRLSPLRPKPIGRAGISS